MPKNRMRGKVYHLSSAKPLTAVNIRPPPNIPGLPTVSKKDLELEVKDVPELSRTSLNLMPHELGLIFGSANGRVMWGKFYTLLKYYTSEPGDFILVEDVIGLFCQHFSKQIQWQHDFNCHQNMVFACLQEYVDTWFDALSAMRMRLRSEPKAIKFLKNHTGLKTKMSTAEKKDLVGQDDDYDWYDDDEEEEEEDPRFTIPDPDPSWFDNLPSSDRDQTAKDVRHVRRKLFRLLLTRFPPLQGVAMKQLPMALNLECGCFSKTVDVNETAIRRYMWDVIEIREKSRNYKVVRIRLDAPGLKIQKKLLKELQIAPAFNLAQGLAPPTPPQPLPSIPKAPVESSSATSVPPPLEMGTRLSGTCKWYNVKDGFGFVETGGHELFVHESNIVGGNPDSRTASLEEDEEVEFEVKQGDKGPEAVNVTGPSGAFVRGSKHAKPFTSDTFSTRGRFARGALRGGTRARIGRGFGTGTVARNVIANAPIIPQENNVPIWPGSLFGPSDSVPVSLVPSQTQVPPPSSLEPTVESNQTDDSDDFASLLNRELDELVASTDPLVSAMPPALYEFCCMLKHRGGRLNWLELHKIQGFNLKEKRLEVQKHILEGNQFESIVMVDMSDLGTIEAQLLKPELFPL